MAYIRPVSYPICPICFEHIELETANTDERGRAVHEECYVQHIVAQTRAGMKFCPESVFGRKLHDQET